MSEKEDFRATKESLAEVVSRAGRRTRSDDAMRRLVDAAFYRETHRAKPVPPREKDTAPPPGSST